MTSAAAALPAGYGLVALGTVASTNATARALAADGAVDGTVIQALRQSGGRGRDGRVWDSPPGNLYVSLLLRPNEPPPQAVQLGFVAAVALGEALAPMLPDPAALTFKWPNDVLLSDAKLAGLLLESQMAGQSRGGGRLDWLVIGIGVNLLSAPVVAAGGGLPATCLAEHGVHERADDLCRRFVHAFAGWRRRWQQQGFAPVRAAWMARAWRLGGQISARLPGGVVQTGTHGGIDDQGLLELRGPRGSVMIAAGDVFPPLSAEVAAEVACC